MDAGREQIEKKALSLGFSLVGVAEAGPLADESARLDEWLLRGYHASMAWMERRRERRQDPREVLPGARSVIVTALNYYTSHQHSSEPGTGKISRYAWGDDYHNVVLRKLEDLAGWIESTFPGERALAYVDTGPLLEKALAARAGLGWQGKHSNLITREFGSWVFLGEVLTTLNIPAGERAVDRCGTCTLCIDACPTEAIVEPYVVDSTRCISYLTIEHRGPVEEKRAEEFSGWIYGCDICQDVCPWNKKFASPAEEAAFEPREGYRAPVLREWAAMTPEEFRLRLTGSPIRRAKWEGLMRNIRIVLEHGHAVPPAD